VLSLKVGPTCRWSASIRVCKTVHSMKGGGVLPHDFSHEVGDGRWSPVQLGRGDSAVQRHPPVSVFVQACKDIGFSGTSHEQRRRSSFPATNSVDWLRSTNVGIAARTFRGY
jgi:hypothetical protein